MTDDNTPIVYNPEDVLKKEARGIDDADFGEIQSVDPEYIITQKGIIDKEIFSFLFYASYS